MHEPKQSFTKDHVLESTTPPIERTIRDHAEEARKQKEIVMKKLWIVGLALCLSGLFTVGEVFARGPGPGRGSGWSRGPVWNHAPGWRHGHGWNHGYRSRVGVSFVVGAPFWAPWYYPAYYPPVVIERQPPVVYVEQSPPAQIVPQAGYWYYCQSLGKYYPEVRGCPENWVKVPPRP
jgi:hypothetical protein